MTSLRGLAAVWVVLYHYSNDLVTLLPATGAFLPFFRQGHFAVPIFFVLSGYVLTYNYLDQMTAPTRATLLRFWARRLARIYPLHLATLLVILAMVIVAARSRLGIARADYSERDFVLNLLLMHAWVPHYMLNWNYPSWSLSSEWFAYLFFPLACPVLNRARRPTTLGGLALVFCLFTVFQLLQGDRLLFAGMIAVIGPFLLGCTLARLNGPGWGVRGAGGVAWGLLGAIVLVAFLAPPWGGPRRIDGDGDHPRHYGDGCCPRVRPRFGRCLPLAFLDLEAAARPGRGVVFIVHGPRCRPEVDQSGGALRSLRRPPASPTPGHLRYRLDGDRCGHMDCSPLRRRAVTALAPSPVLVLSQKR